MEGSFHIYHEDKIVPHSQLTDLIEKTIDGRPIQRLVRVYVSCIILFSLHGVQMFNHLINIHTSDGLL